MSLDGFVQNVLEEGVDRLLERNDFIEVLRISSIPGACSLEVEKQLTEFFNQDANIAILFEHLCVEPEPWVKISPNYKEYALNFNAYTVLCVPRFSAGITRTIFSGTYMPSQSRNVLLAKFMQTHPLDAFVAEALRRFFEICLGFCPARQMLESCGKYGSEFLHAMMYQGLACPNLKSIVPAFLSSCQDDPAIYPIFCTLGWQVLQQLFPWYVLAPVAVREENEFLDRIRLHADNHMKFQLMDHTEDFLMDLICAENEPPSRARNMSNCLLRQLRYHPDLSRQWIRGILQDFKSSSTYRSAGLSILIGFLRNHGCHCVQYLSPHDHDNEVDPLSCIKCISCPHASTTIPLFLELFRVLPTILQYLVEPSKTYRYSEMHIQGMDLVSALIRYECVVVDAMIVAGDITEPLIWAMRHFRDANILQAAVYRIFRMAYEDMWCDSESKDSSNNSNSNSDNNSPKAKKTRVSLGSSSNRSTRTAHDFLRRELLRRSHVIEKIMKQVKSSEIPGFVDIALSLDRAFKIDVPFPPSVVEKWSSFRKAELDQMQRKWNTAVNFEDLPEHVQKMDFRQDVDDIDKVMEEERIRKRLEQEALEKELAAKAKAEAEAKEAEARAEEEAEARAKEEAEARAKEEAEARAKEEGEAQTAEDVPQSAENAELVTPSEVSPSPANEVVDTENGE